MPATAKKRIVIKVGTNLLLDKALKKGIFSQLADSIKKLSDYELILVSSGAIALGNLELKQKFKHEDDIMRNVSAVVGQSDLITAYKQVLGNKVGQVLITKQDLMNRESYLHIKKVIEYMLDHSIIPIINENDTIKTRTNKFKDNDQVALEIASKMQADLLIILTNVKGVFTADPKDENAKVVKEINKDNVEDIAIGKKSSTSTGGMSSKLDAALLASKIGIPVVIADGNEKNIINKIIDGQSLGTSIKAEDKIKSKKRWILLTKEKGSIDIDEGAFTALKKDKSLLAAGIREVSGNFLVNDVISIKCNNKIVAKAISDCTSDIIKFIKGKNTEDIKKILDSYNVVAKHENIALVK